MSVVRHSPLITTVKLGTIHVRKLPLQRNSHCSAPDAPSCTTMHSLAIKTTKDSVSILTHDLL